MSRGPEFLVTPLYGDANAGSSAVADLADGSTAAAYGGGVAQSSAAESTGLVTVIISLLLL